MYIVFNQVFEAQIVDIDRSMGLADALDSRLHGSLLVWLSYTVPGRDAVEF
jgi:hypothetical protein